MLVATGHIELAAAAAALFAMRTSNGTLAMVMRAGARLIRTSLFIHAWTEFLRTAEQLRMSTA
ncbi:hypothetical protein ACWGH2_36680 [Streptomyces sp. NPDC054871]